MSCCRIPGNLSQVKRLLVEFDEKSRIDVGAVSQHTLGTVLKRILKEHHIDPLIPSQAQLLLVKAFDENSDAAVRVRAVFSVCVASQPRVCCTGAHGHRCTGCVTAGGASGVDSALAALPGCE